ncbi:DUF1616 domain-containing protein [Methanothermobacter sp.]|uniref:DUF1616 domain-containing protein n=1 Tax=Methanothermobacter sp. TaxID=1884223 RepID=UPI002623E749|nr:DUF1616 domain-containing protein [Methanothermobacter sp.]MDI9617668.1 DUF1616 domain-containing protein [Methanothermobacter sp.]
MKLYLSNMNLVSILRNDKDIFILALLSLVCLFVILSFPKSLFKSSFIITFTFFLLGYSFISLLYPEQNDFDIIKRILLSVPISFSILPLIGYVLDKTTGILFVPLLVSLFSFVMLCFSLAIFLRRLTKKPFSPTLIVPAGKRDYLFLGISVFLILIFLLVLVNVGRIEGSLWNHGYIYIENLIIKTGHIPIKVSQSFADNSILDVVNHYLVSDYMRTLISSELFILGIQNTNYPFTTLVTFSCILFVLYNLNEDIFISLFFSSLYLLNPFVLTSNFYLNGSVLSTGMLILYLFFLIRIFKREGSKNFLILLVLTPLLLRFYHTMAFYTIAITLTFLLLYLLKMLYLVFYKIYNENSLKFALKGGITYLMFFVFLNVFLTLQASTLATVIKNTALIQKDVAFIRLFNYFMGFFGYSSARDKLSPYLYYNPSYFYLNIIVLIPLVLLTFIFANKLRGDKGGKIINDTEKTYLISFLVFILILSILLSLYDLPNRSFIIFGVSFLLITSSIFLRYLKEATNNKIAVNVAILLAILNILTVPIVLSTPSQTYFFSEDSDVSVANWSSFNVDQPVLCDMKTLSLIFKYNNTNTIILRDAQMNSREPTKYLVSLYKSPSEFLKLAKKDFNARYFIINDDIRYKVFVGNNYFLKPVGYRVLRGFLDTANVVYDNGNAKVIRVNS